MTIEFRRAEGGLPRFKLIITQYLWLYYNKILTLQKKIDPDSLVLGFYDHLNNLGSVCKTGGKNF